MNNTSRVSPKGQVTIPIEIRRLLGISPKDNVRFIVDDGCVRIERAVSVLDKYFMALPPLDPPRTWKEIREEVHDEIAERYMRKVAEWNDESAS